MLQHSHPVVSDTCHEVRSVSYSSFNLFSISWYYSYPAKGVLLDRTASSQTLSKGLRSILYHYSWQVKSLPILISLFLYHISPRKSMFNLTLLNYLVYLL